MSTIIALIRKHPVPAYYVLVFTISLGGCLIAIGPGGILGITPISGAQLPFTCRLASKPKSKSNEGYWSAKIETNRARDARNVEALAQQGWTVLELWECEVRRLEGLEERLQAFMQS